MAYAFYECITEVCWLIGMLIGFYLSAQGLSASHILLNCSMLNLIASILSIFLIKDPALILERNLVKIERNTYSTCRGLIAALGATRNADRINIMAENSTKGFCLGLIAFFTATKILFTPLPIFLSRDLALQESIINAYFCIVYAEVCIVLERKIGYLAEGELSTYPVVYEDLVKEEGGS